MPRRAACGIRVGLHSGIVLMRSVGYDMQLDYEPVGHAVHLAARMEQLAKPNTIYLTAATKLQAEDFIKAEPLGPMVVKGVLSPIVVWRLIGPHGVATRWEARRARSVKGFVGRTRELARLALVLDKARSACRTVAIVGEPGIGKSRLLHEFLHTSAVAKLVNSANWGLAARLRPEHLDHPNSGQSLPRTIYQG